MGDQQDRITRAAEELERMKRVAGNATVTGYFGSREVAARLLEAADAPPKPVWPTDRSLDYFLDPLGRPLKTLPTDTPEDVRNTLRAAFLADEGYKLMIAWGKAVNLTGRDHLRGVHAKALHDFLDANGLLEGEDS